MLKISSPFSLYLLTLAAIVMIFSSCINVESERLEINEYPFGVAQYLPAKKTQDLTYLSGSNEWPMSFKMYYLGDALSQNGDQKPLRSKTIQAKYADINNDGFRISSSIYATANDTFEILMVEAKENYCLPTDTPNTLMYSRKMNRIINSTISNELYQSLGIDQWPQNELFLSNQEHFVFAKGGIIAFKKCEEWYMLKVHRDI